MKRLPMLLLVIFTCSAVAQAPVKFVGYTVECNTTVIDFQFSPPLNEVTNSDFNKTLPRASSISYSIGPSNLKVYLKKLSQAEVMDLRNAIAGALASYFEHATIADRSTEDQKACKPPPPPKRNSDDEQ